jgi:putative ABC transport system permease protein
LFFEVLIPTYFAETKLVMLQSIFALALRKFLKNLSLSLINLSGLVIGLTTTILIFIWVTYEFGFDRYHPDNERVFAVLMNETVEGEIETYDETQVPLSDLTDAIPEIEAITRIDNTRVLINYDKKSVQKYGMYADASYFNVFSPTLVSGERAHPFPDNNSIVISSRLAQLMFGDNNDAIGKILTVDVKNSFKITAVFSEFPDNSSLSHYEFILPFHAKRRNAGEWQNYYVKLNDAHARDRVQSKIDPKIATFLGNTNTRSFLFCLTDWRLHWNFQNGRVSGGRIIYVIIFIVTAIFILLMAIMNYVNISTAGAAKRAREIGVRKMTGATQRILVRQFMIESLCITFIASLLALGATYLLMPLFNEITGSRLLIRLTNPALLTGLFSISIFTGLLAGCYPAFLLASLNPAAVLKGNSNSVLTGGKLRKTLVVFQFTLSVILIFCAVVVHQQTNYLLKKDLGYDKHNVINIWLQPEYSVPLQSFKTEILTHSSVLSAGLGGASPMEINGYAEVRWPEKSGTAPVLLNGVSSDFDMLPTLKLEFVQGRNFSNELPSDSSAFIITQKAADLLGFKDPIGQTITYTMFGEQQGKIIGVLKDFHNDNIHAPINPVIFTVGTKSDLNNLFVRYQDGKLEEALAHIKTVFSKFHPGIPLHYSFLDSDFEDQFYREKLLGNLSSFFTIVAIALAALGLVGLTMFNTQRRTKEIGVRKVLGASVLQVQITLVKDFFMPVAISFLLAFPIAYWLMERFLASYPSRIATPIFLLLVVGLFMSGFVLLAVSVQSLRTATKNPIDSLKVE